MTGVCASWGVGRRVGGCAIWGCWVGVLAQSVGGITGSFAAVVVAAVLAPGFAGAGRRAGVLLEGDTVI